MPTRGRRHPLTTPKWIVGHLLALSVVIAFSQFGVWQLRRHVERLATDAVLVERWAAAPTDLDQALAAADADVGDGRTAALALLDRRVRVSGVFEPLDEVLRRPVSRDGRPGYHLVTPLRLDDDPAGRRLWVERGWVPDGFDEVPVDAAPVAEGRVEVTGWLRPTTEPPAGWIAAIAPRDPPTGRLAIVAYLDPQRLGAQVAGPLVPAVLYLESVVPAVEGPWPLPPVAPAVRPGPHLGYALQWFAFTLITVVGYAALVRRVAREARAA